MSNRPGQKGTVVLKNDQWRGRYLEDVPGQYERVRRSVYLAPATGTGSITKTEAKKLLSKVIEKQGINTEEKLQQAISPVVSLETFKQKAEWWKQNKACFFKSATRLTMFGHLSKHIYPAIGNLPVEKLDEKTMQGFISKLHGSGLAPKSTANIVGVVKLVVGQKVWRDWSLKLPARTRTEQPFFTQEHLEQIIQATPKRYQVVFCLLASTGMRVSEAAGKNVEDVDLVERTITIRRSLSRQKEEQTPKTKNAYRTVTIDQGLADILREHLQGRTTGRLFVSARGTPIDGNNLRNKGLKPVLRNLGLKGHIHSFRHSRISILQQAGVHGDLIKAWVGHSSLITTAGYTHFPESFRKDTVDKLESLRLSPGTTVNEEQAQLLFPATA